MTSRPAPAKPWEARAGTSGATTSTTPGDGLPKPWERQASDATAATVTPASTANNALVSTQQQSRPWETQNNSLTQTGYGGYGTNTYGSSPYSRPGYGAMYGAGGYGSMYGGGYGTGYGGYGSSMYGGMYGGGMYNRPYGGMYGGGMFGGGPMMMGGPGWDPNDPNGPPVPPSAWQTMLHSISGIVHFFGRLSFLVDENAHAVHFFITALLQLLDRFGSLYGELARFVLRLLGFRPKEKPQVAEVMTPQNQQQQQRRPNQGYRPPGMPSSTITNRNTGGGGWDSLWKS